MRSKPSLPISLLNINLAVAKRSTIFGLQSSEKKEFDLSEEQDDFDLEEDQAEFESEDNRPRCKSKRGVFGQGTKFGQEATSGFKQGVKPSYQDKVDKAIRRDGFGRPGKRDEFGLEQRTRKAETVRKDLQMQKTEGGVFSVSTLDSIGKLGSEGAIDRIMGPISTGKEADVFRGKKGKENIAIKVFRLASASYFRNPTVLGYILGDERFKGMKRTPRALIGLWSLKEFRNLKKAEEAGILAPRPIAIEKNVLVMSFIGDNDAAPRLLDAEIKDPKAVFKELVNQIKKLYRANLVHADLSEFNILLWKEKPYLIDFGQGVLLTHPKAKEFLERDVRNVCNFFNKKGVECDADAVLNKVRGKN